MRNLNFLVKDIFIIIKMGLSDACHFLKCFEVWIFYVYQESKSLWIERTNDKFRISRINLHCSYKNYTRYWHHSQLLCKFHLWQLFIILIKWQGKAPTLKILKQWQALNVHGHRTNQIVVIGQSAKERKLKYSWLCSCSFFERVLYFCGKIEKQVRVGKIPRWPPRPLPLMHHPLQLE